MDRTIGDTEHPLIKNAKELYIWFHKEAAFKLVSAANFPRTKGHCKVCPMNVNKSNGKPYYCQPKILTWETFKYHLYHAERIIGELIAFPADIKSLPTKSNYIKHRNYGDLHQFQHKEKFFIFDVKQNKFIEVLRINLPKLYGKRKKCLYCPCNYKIKSPTTLIRHLQVIETKFFCHLLFERLEQNDSRNMQRIQNFVNSLNRNKPEVLADDVVDEEEDESDQEMEYIELPNNFEIEDNLPTVAEDRNAILSQFEESYRRFSEEMNYYFDELDCKFSSLSLRQGVIDTQEQMTLCKRVEDFQENEKEFKFMKAVNLKVKDLDFLMNKYGISDEYEIDTSSVTLFIQLKEDFCQEFSVTNYDEKLKTTHDHSSVYLNECFDTTIEPNDKETIEEKIEQTQLQSELDLGQDEHEVLQNGFNSDDQIIQMNEEVVFEKDFEKIDEQNETSEQIVFEHLELVPESVNGLSGKGLRLVPTVSTDDSGFSKITSIFPSFISVKKERVLGDENDQAARKRLKTN